MFDRDARPVDDLRYDRRPIMIYYAIRQHKKYNGAQLKHRYKIYGT